MKNKKQIIERISVCAPGSAFSKKDFLKGIAWLESIEAHVRFSKDIFQEKGYYAGTDPVRARTLLQAIRAGDVILAARGGGGCNRLFPLVKKGIKSLNPYSKIFIGSSDLTFLYLFLRKLSPQIFVYGPMVCRYGKKEFRGFEKKTIAGTMKGNLEFPVQYPKGFHMEKRGVPVKGKLDGGNLSILAASLGTPYEWNPDGPVLYLEDVNEPLYRIDRMLTQLNHAGKFEKIKSVLVGKMEAAEKPLPYPGLRECLREHFGKAKGPIMTKIPTGHGKTQWPFFLGGTYSVGNAIRCLGFGKES